MQQTWIEAAALGAQQPLPAAASTGCALPAVPPDLLQKGNQGKPLTDCSLLHLRWCLQQQPRPSSCPATEQHNCRHSRQAPTPPQCSDAKLLCCSSRLLGSDNKYFEAESAVGSWSTLRLRGKNCLTDSAWQTLLLFGVCPVLKLVCRDLAYGYNEKT